MTDCAEVIVVIMSLELTLEKPVAECRDLHKFGSKNCPYVCYLTFHVYCYKWLSSLRYLSRIWKWLFEREFLENKPLHRRLCRVAEFLNWWRGP